MSLFGPPDVAKLKAKGNVKGLIQVLSDDKDWKVQQTAVAALGDIGDGRFVEPLVAAIKHEDGDGRSLVIDIGGFTTDFLATNQGGQR